MPALPYASHIPSAVTVKHACKTHSPSSRSFTILLVSSARDTVPVSHVHATCACRPPYCTHTRKQGPTPHRHPTCRLEFSSGWLAATYEKKNLGPNGTLGRTPYRYAGEGGPYLSAIVAWSGPCSYTKGPKTVHPNASWPGTPPACRASREARSTRASTVTGQRFAVADTYLVPWLSCHDQDRHTTSPRLLGAHRIATQYLIWLLHVGSDRAARRHCQTCLALSLASALSRPFLIPAISLLRKSHCCTVDDHWH